MKKTREEGHRAIMKYITLQIFTAERLEYIRRQQIVSKRMKQTPKARTRTVQKSLKGDEKENKIMRF